MSALLEQRPGWKESHIDCVPSPVVALALEMLSFSGECFLQAAVCQKLVWAS